MNYFITGATGYIGSWLVKELTDKGHTVHALVRNPDTAKHIAFPNVKFFKGDITDAESMRKAMDGCDYIFHLAAFAKVWTKDSKIFYDLNVRATIVLMNVARESNIKKIVVASTAGVLGPSIDRPVDETTARQMDFFNEYESSKAISELSLKDFVLDGMNIVMVSPTRVYGPFLHGKSESITLLVERTATGKWRFIPGDGSKVGNYIFIHDVIQGLVLAMEKGRAGHNYLLGGSNLDYTTFFRVIREHSGAKQRMIHMPIAAQMWFSRLQLIKTWFGMEPVITPKWIAKGKYHWEVNTDKAFNELGLKPTSFEEGIKKTVDWIKSKK